MPVTRSASRAAAAEKAVPVSAAADEREKPQAAKRKAVSTPTKSKAPRKKAKSKGNITDKVAVSDAGSTANVNNSQISVPPGEDVVELVPAVLTFSFEEAKQHLINVDRRFEDMFKRMKCKPFEHLERFDPFRTLVTSIMGQQISWIAARSITNRFIRIFDESLPAKLIDYTSVSAFFPTARQVAATDIATLRNAGLSGRKAEYVLDLAQRFADGRLSTEKLLQASDGDLYDMLIEVRGIGRWTVDMFALFSLRRPDILPVGDLGVQRGVLRWFLSLHAPSSYPLTISPEKLPKNSDQEDDTGADTDIRNSAGEDSLPVLGEPSASSQARPVTPDASSIPPVPVAFPATPVKKGKGVSSTNEDEVEGAALPPPFTPSINETLNMSAYADELAMPPPLPEGLTPAILRGRLDGKKKIRGALLTPKEMEELTDTWRPYRSLGVYYMWALAEPPK